MDDRKRNDRARDTGEADKPAAVPPQPQPDAAAAAADHQVRAGPGDAGASQAPRTLPRGPQHARREKSASRLNGILIAVAVLLLFVVVFAIS